MSHYLGLVMEWAPGGNLTNLVSRCVQNEDAECARGLMGRAARMGYVPPSTFYPSPVLRRIPTPLIPPSLVKTPPIRRPPSKCMECSSVLPHPLFRPAPPSLSLLPASTWNAVARACSCLRMRCCTCLDRWGEAEGGRAGAEGKGGGGAGRGNMATVATNHLTDTCVSHVSVCEAKVGPFPVLAVTGKMHHASHSNGVEEGLAPNRHVLFRHVHAPLAPSCRL